ncbi:hypothetical protein NA57DRAFT_51162 [Rhizodiscina lignyota]|uniref:Uncharacterized protein n=1 Tax=Rhizodiscina lignyota TaxID=1504668 RepID=A0A9P4IR92_9PEZI|nr:hypothetical protein NA57DRAFT_51162 [Rhizodiscina lignyota]
MAQHRNKRLFQPSITSFFAHAERNGGDLIDSSQSEQKMPVLPPNVQANLLNVGMRIRKSVPAGYKNKAADDIEEERRTLYNAPVATSYRPAELQPFCGIHKIGGLAAQSETYQDMNMSTDPALPVDAQALLPPSSFNSAFSSLSQESSVSTLSTDSMPAVTPQSAPLSTINANTRSQKRRFEEDNDEREQDWDERMASFAPLEPPISPRTQYPVKHTSMPNFAVLTSPTLAARTYAHPTSRARRKDANNHSYVELGMADGNFDFEEADFLKPLEADEMDIET